MITKSEASILIEDVLDTLVEVGNGATDAMLHEAATKLFKFRDKYFKFLTEEVVEPEAPVIEEVQSEPITEEVQPEFTAQQQPVERRSIFRSVESEWVQVEEGLMGIKPGDVFYMREASGEVVKDADGCEVFVATGTPKAVINENNENTTGIEVEQDQRFKVDSIGLK